jgi:hypothetical protein
MNELAMKFMSSVTTNKFADRIKILKKINKYVISNSFINMTCHFIYIHVILYIYTQTHTHQWNHYVTISHWQFNR